ncbi:MAG: glycosyltransferase [Bacteroidales bacterium]
MNIAFIHEEFPKGGGEQVTVDLATCFKKLSYCVFVFVWNFHEEKLSDSAREMEFIKLPYSVSNKKNSAFIADKIKRLCIDVLVFPDFIPSYLPSLRRETSAKILFVSHHSPFWELEYKCENGRYKAGRSFGKWLEWYLLRYPKFKTGIAKKRLINRYRNLYCNVDAFGVLCDEYGRVFNKELGFDGETTKFHTLTNPSMNSANGYFEKDKTLLFVGRLENIQKHIDWLLMIWREVEPLFPDWKLMIVGDGPDKGMLMNMASKYGLKRVVFCGYTKNPALYYQKAQILCLTSTSEGWGLVLADAQSFGCAAIAFDCSAGVREILSPQNENGVLVTPFNTGEYVQKLSELMRNRQTFFSEKYRAPMGGSYNKIISLG